MKIRIDYNGKVYFAEPDEVILTHEAIHVRGTMKKRFPLESVTSAILDGVQLLTQTDVIELPEKMEQNYDSEVDLVLLEYTESVVEADWKLDKYIRGRVEKRLLSMGYTNISFDLEEEALDDIADLCYRVLRCEKGGSKIVRTMYTLSNGG